MTTDNLRHNVEYSRDLLLAFFKEHYGLEKHNVSKVIKDYRDHIKALLVHQRFPDQTKLGQRDYERVTRLCAHIKQPERRHEAMQITGREIRGLLDNPDSMKSNHNMRVGRLYGVYLLSDGAIDPTKEQLFRTGGIQWPNEINLSLEDRRNTKFDVAVVSNDLNDGGTRHDILVTSIDLQDAWAELRTSEGKLFATLDFGFSNYLASFRRMDGGQMEPKNAPPALLQDGDFVDPENILDVTNVVGFQIKAKKRHETARKVWNVNNLDQAYEVATCVTFADTEVRIAVTAPMQNIQITVSFGEGAENLLQQAQRTHSRRQKEKAFDTLARENLASHLVRKLLLKNEGETYLGNAILVVQEHALNSAPPLDPRQEEEDAS